MMRTIQLDEAAFGRLAAMRKSSAESFSAVVKRITPSTGTLGAFLEFVEDSPVTDSAKDDVMEAEINERSSVKENPWT